MPADLAIQKLLKTFVQRRTVPRSDPRSVPKGMKARDLFDPYGHIDTIKVKTRDFK